MSEKNRNLRFAEVFDRLTDGRSQRDLGRQAGISPTHIGNMLWGTPPSYRMLVKVARNLEFKPDEIRELFEAAGYALPEADLPGSPDPDHLADQLTEALEAQPEIRPGILKQLNERFETGREAFDRLLAEAFHRLAARGIPLLLPTHYPDSETWENLTVEDAERMVGILEADSVEDYARRNP